MHNNLLTLFNVFLYFIRFLLDKILKLIPIELVRLLFLHTPPKFDANKNATKFSSTLDCIINLFYSNSDYM